MTTVLLDKNAPEVGKLWVPARSLSLPGEAIKPVRRDIFITWQFRPKWSSKYGLKLPEIPNPYAPAQQVRELLNPFLKDLPPDALENERIFLDVGHNERVDMGAGINITQLFGAVSGATTSIGPIVALAIASASLTVAHGDLSLGSASANVTTNEFTTIGLSRVAATVQNYVTTTTLDAVVSVDLFKSLSVTGTGTANGAGLYDSTTVSGSHLFVEKNFASSASVINGDTLQVTITITL